jgi:hypothetical protein
MGSNIKTHTKEMQMPLQVPVEQLLYLYQSQTALNIPKIVKYVDCPNYAI